MKNITKYNKKNITNDIIAGIIVALVSIPISMGYAQIAGLPAVYGLYASILPVFIYGLVTSSPQFVFGVDATPAALVGGMLASMAIASGSEEAMALVPVITVIVAVWLFIFYIVKAGRIVNYISTPVMGGFISGIGMTIILMQVPKLFGGNPGTGELFVLLYNIYKELDNFNLLSLILGVGTVIIIMAAKKISPKFPMSVVMLVLGVVSTAVFHIDEYGVKLLPQVDAGLPKFVMPDFSLLTNNTVEIIILSFSIALVIVAQTLLATNNYANRYGYKINNNREVLSYALANVASAALGGCPLNGSVSRTGIADQFGCKSQLMSITAAFTMLIIVLVGTPILKYMPVPVLTGIVIAALIGILEFKLSKKLFKANRTEFFIFMAAFWGVLIFGTIYGVVIGVILSFVAVIIRAVVPPKSFLGVIPGHEGFYNLNRNRNAHPIEGTLIYRFSGTLFFANINTFQEDIENAVTPDIKRVIVDASGIGNVDITAAERLVSLYRRLQAKGIRFYITEHVGNVNDQLRTLGAACLVEEGVVRRTITLALRDSGMERPYKLSGVDNAEVIAEILEDNEHLAEMEWAFGADADMWLEKLAAEVVENFTEETSERVLEGAEAHTSWGRIGLFDEDEFLEHLEIHLHEIAERTGRSPQELERLIERRRMKVEQKLEKLNPTALHFLQAHRAEVMEHMKETNPELYEKLMKIKSEIDEDR